MNSTFVKSIALRELLTTVRDSTRFLNSKGLCKRLKASKLFLSGYLAGSAIFKTVRVVSRLCITTLIVATTYAIRHPLQVALNAFFLISLATMAITGSEINKQVILSEISESTLMNIIESSKYNRGFRTNDMKQSGLKELTGVGAPAWIQKESIKAILYHARKAGLSLEDQAVLLAIANIESGFNPFAQANTTSACGLFQFVQKTGEMFALKSTDCMDPWKNASAGIIHYIANYNSRVKPSVENLEGTEKVFRSFELSYYLHHDGPSSSNPSNDVKAIVLDGTQFLFNAYHTLLKEAENEKSAPSFSQIFADRMWMHITTLTDGLLPKSLPQVALAAKPYSQRL